jgi:hypothetical protein
MTKLRTVSGFIAAALLATAAGRGFQSSILL